MFFIIYFIAACFYFEWLYHRIFTVIYSGIDGVGKELIVVIVLVAFTIIYHLYMIVTVVMLLTLLFKALRRKHINE